MKILIRPRAWWYNKVPLSVLTGLLLVDRHPFTLSVVFALVGLVAIVCSVANYGYALNELYDRDEDRRARRSNAAEDAGPAAMFAIIGGSALVALLVSLTVGGIAATVVTAGELFIPLAYSVPPLRTKHRGWVGVICDAAAAHVYPALLAFVVISHEQLRALSAALVATGIIWALMTGLRGILSHQLQSEDHDRRAGLVTVVHKMGHGRLARFVTFVILPIEMVAFAAFLAEAGVGGVFVVCASVFLVYEVLKFSCNGFSVFVFDHCGQRYIPFVDEGAYKVWGPLALAVDAAADDPFYLVVALLCAAGFWSRFRSEGEQIWRTARLVHVRFADFVGRVLS